MSDTIAAIATSQSSGGIGIVRISGDNAREIADKIFANPKNKRIINAKGYTALYGYVLDDGEIIDEAVVLIFTAPNSYTGEDVVEIDCHGGTFVTNEVLRSVLKAGARLSTAGEFTRRAFINNKISLTQAEAVMDIISSKGKQAAKAALELHKGALSKRLKGISDEMLKIAASLSAWSDYPEDDIPDVDGDSLEFVLVNIENDLNDLLSKYDAGRAIREGVNTVIVRRPNVGKSTLMNLLSGCERSIVTQYAGTTRDIIEETVKLGDFVLRLADTAGIRETDNPIESIGVSKAKERFFSADIIIAVFDFSEKLTQEDMDLIDLCLDRNVIAVINKNDLFGKIDIEYVKQRISEVVLISAFAESRVDDIESAISRVLKTADLDPSAGILSNERQRECALKSQVAIKEAIEALQNSMTLDAVAICIDAGIAAILELTGERVSDKVVDEVFKRFCVGK